MIFLDFRQYDQTSAHWKLYHLLSPPDPKWSSIVIWFAFIQACWTLNANNGSSLLERHSKWESSCLLGNLALVQAFLKQKRPTKFLILICTAQQQTKVPFQIFLLSNMSKFETLINGVKSIYKCVRHPTPHTNPVWGPACKKMQWKWDADQHRTSV